MSDRQPIIFEWRIEGRVASKKNGWRPVSSKGRVFMVPSNAWRKFEKHALKQLEGAGTPNIEGPLYAEYDFHLKGKGYIDLDNLIAGINDVLEKAGIIENDRDIMEMRGRKILGADEYETLVRISGLK